MSSPAEYRKKPITIKAMQWDGTAEGAGPIIDWILREGGTANYYDPSEPGGARIRITTTHGDDAYLRAGDWVVPDRSYGTFYPIADEVFVDTYEPVNRPA